MLLSNWLRPLRSRIRSRRDSWKAAYVPTAMRTHQAVERLETRLYLSGLTSYSTASADWFGNIDASFSSASGIDGSSMSDGTSSSGNVRQFLVRLTPEATAQAGSLAGVQELISDNSVELVVTDGLGLPGQVIVSTTERDSVQVVRSLDTNSAVAYFEEDFSVGATTRFPNEQTESTNFSRQFGLNNTGQNGGTNNADIDAPEAWDITIGSVETVVSVIDSGVDFTHPDLYLNIWLNQGELPPQFTSVDATDRLNDIDDDGLITFRDLNDAANSSFVTDLNSNGYIDASDLLEDPKWADGIDTDDNGFEDDLVGWDFFQNDNRPFDEHRHGTHVAGILGAVGDNSFGVSGVNWQTSIMALRFLDEDNRGDISAAVEAINYTTLMRNRDDDPVNVRVSNNSWGSSGSFSQTLFDAVAGNLAADILYVAAAGNGDVLGQGVDNDDVAFFPANLELANVISVAALNDRGELASFSNFGTTTVDIAAPGVNIVSTELEGDFITRSGTSMATPFVAGVAALVFDQFREATAAEVRDAILSGAVSNSSLDDLIAGSRSLNAFGALTASTFAPVPELVPVATITADGTLNVDITVTYTDDGSVNTSSFDIRDIEVTRLGFSETLLTPAEATTTTVNVDGQDRDAAVYRFTAPGGTWDATENGTWFVSLREGEIQDDLGLYSALRQIGRFSVNIDDPNVYFVNTTLDTIDANLSDDQPTDAAGRISIRSAIMHANQVGVGTTVVVPDGIYTLVITGQGEDAAVTGDLDLTSIQGLTLIGGGAFSTMIDAQQLDRVFDAASGSITELRGLSIRNGNADEGGGVRNAGTLTVGSTLVAGNTADTAGGGIYSTGILTISNSSVEDNQTTSRFFGLGGGGLAVVGTPDASAGQTSILNTSIVNNTSTEAGGGVFAVDAGLTVTNVTVSGNTAQRGDGGGFLLRTTNESSSSFLTSVTLTQNNALIGNGGGLATDTSITQVTMSNSIVTDNLARVSPAVEGFIISDGTNLFGQPSETDINWRTLADNVADIDQIGTTQSPLDSGLGPLQRAADIVQTQSPVSSGAASNSDVAGLADLALTSGLSIVYSTVELEPNNSRGEAMRLDDRGWSLDANPDIANSTTIPHVTVTGTGDGTFDYFSFTVSAPNTNAVFDIDNGALATGEVFDTELFLFDSSDNLLASNDNAAIDGGSTSTLDSRIEHTFSKPGYYTFAIGAFDSSHVDAGRLTGNTAPVGTSYVVNISVDHHPLATTAYNPASTANALVPLAGTTSGNDYIFSALESSFRLTSEPVSAVGDTPYSLVVSDVDGDGINDIVTANRSSDNVSVLRGNGNGTFQPAQNFSVGADPRSVVVSDISGDGVADILTANRSSGTVSVLKGNGDGTFQAVQNVATGLLASSVVVGDVNSDGITDVVTANSFSDTISVLKGNGDGTFQVATSFAAASPRSVTLGDVNVDGFVDIVSGGESVSILKGNGDGTFQDALDFAAGSAITTVILEDVNKDGVADVIAGNFNSGNVSVLNGNNDGTFQTARNFPAGGRPTSLNVADIDGDGIVDILTAGNNVSILKGNGDGTFQMALKVADGSLSSVVAHDVNRDGITDIIAANSSSNNVSVLSGNGPIVLGLPSSLGNVRAIPHIGRPFLFTQVNGQTYWLTSDEAASQYTLWSFSDDTGVRIRSKFSTKERPNDLSTSGNTIVIRSGSDLLLFEPASNQLIVFHIPTGAFQQARHFPVGDRPESVAIGDVDGDGFSDIATANFNSGNVSVLKGNNDGTFRDSEEFSSGAGAESVIFHDINGDGLADIITANRLGNTVSVLRGNGDGTFQNAQLFPIRFGPSAVVAGDVNGDGFADIVTANRISDTVGVLNGNGDGTFQDASYFPVGESPSAVIIGDVNDDGVADLVVVNAFTDNVSILAGDGTGSFGGARHFATGDLPYSAVLGDINGDGIDDIATTSARDGSVSVLSGNGDGTFQFAGTFAVGERTESIALGDVSGDGINDIITANRFSDNVSVLTNKGDGTFRSAIDFSTANTPTSLVLGDINGDNIPDIVTTNELVNSVSVLLGNSRSSDVLELAGTTVLGTMTFRPNGESDFQRMSINSVASAIGLLVPRGNYDVIQIDAFEDKVLALVQFTEETPRPNELQLLLIDVPQLDPETRVVLPSAAENLTLNSALRLVGGGDRQLFANGDHIYLTAEIIGSGIGSELLVFDRTNGLRLVADLLPGAESSQVHDFVAVGDSVYFTALASRVDNNTQQPVLRRELFLLEPATGTVRAVRAGQEVTGKPSLVGSTLFFNSSLQSGSPNQLLSYDTTQDGVPSIGAFEPVRGDVTGTVFLDRNSDGRRSAGEPGRSGVTLFVDVNDNGRREESEPTAVTRLDDPATSEDETGQYEFFGLPAGEVRIREVSQAGFTQTSPLQVLPTAPELTLLSSATPDVGNRGLGLPSVIGGNVVYVDQTNASASQLVLNGEAIELTIPGETVAIQSIGSAHAQDGSSIVFTATLVDGRELVLERDARGDVSVVVDTGQAITSQPIGGSPSLTTLTDIEDGRNGGFDSLSISNGSVGFLAQTDGSATKYFLGGVSGGRFAEFVSGQAILDGDNEFFVDRVVEGTGAVLSGSDLFLNKSTLDAQVGGNTGWRITTRSGDEILPLTFFDRIFDVSVSGLSALFRASDVTGDKSIFLARAGGGVSLLADATTGIGRIVVFDTSGSESPLPSVAIDGENTVFVSGGDFPVGDSPVGASFNDAFASLSLGDVNGDGVLDVVTANSFSANVSVLEGNGDGTFQTPQSFPVGINPFAVSLGDLTGDGVLDVVTANDAGNSVSVLIGNGGGTFRAARNIPLGTSVIAVTLGDVNGDEILDIVTVKPDADAVSVLAGNGNGTFQAAQSFAVGSLPFSVSLGDVNGDEALDIVTANFLDNTVSVLTGNGDGTFQTEQILAVDSGPFSVSLKDVTSDGVLDIITAYRLLDLFGGDPSGSISVAEGNGDGSFQAPQFFAVGDNPVSIALGDLTGDGVLDIVTANEGSNDVTVLAGNGDGSFQTPQIFSTGHRPFSVALGDLTGDEILDIVTANSGSLDVTVLAGDGNGGFRRQQNLYAQISGEDALRRIAGRADFLNQTDFPGQVLTDLAISHDAISGDSIVFRATFSGGTEAIYRARLESEPVAIVNVIAGQSVSDVLFGSIAQPGTIRGVSFTDTNLDGVFNAGDSVNEGRSVFLDENLNGIFDSESEISEVTDADGEFVFANLVSERTYVVRESLPNGKAATFPRTLTEATVRLDAAGTLEINTGSVDASALGESADGEVQGVIFSDVNGNGVQDSTVSEPGITNLTVFVDENGDGILNGGERSSTTAADGSYAIDQLRGIQQDVRVVLPNNTTEQTNALGNSFQTQKLQTRDTPAEAAIADINDDGFADLVVSVLNVGELRTFLNDGNGNFVEAEPLLIGGSPDVTVPLRLNGESNPSAVVVAHPNLQRVDIVLPDADASDGSGFSLIELVRPADLASGGILSDFSGTDFIARGIVTGDFNGDMIDDIAIAAERGPSGKGGAVVTFAGNAQGDFTHEQTLFIDEQDAVSVQGIAAGRFIAGGDVGLVVTGFNSHTAVILRNSGAAGVDANRFTVERTLTTANQRGTSSVQIADLDGNGQGDIVVANSLSGSVSLFEGNADGSFEDERQFAAGTFPTSLKVEDLDGDGKDDILFTVVAGSDRIGILRNLGKIGPDGRVEFQALETSGVAQLPDGTTAFSLTIGQLDSNETPDVIVTLRLDPGLQLNTANVVDGLNTVNVALNSVVPGGRNVDLPSDTRQVAGQDFGLLPITSGITVSKSSVSVSESGTTDTFTVQLDTQPTSDVVLSVVSDDTGEATVDKATLTFTSSNWDQLQIVTVRGVDDLLVDGDIQSAITVSVVDGSSDDTYDDVANTTVNVTTADNDDPNAPTQIVSAERSELFGLPGGAVSFDLKYDTSDTDSTLSGVSFRLHFDSARLSWVAATNLLDNGFDIAAAGSPQADSSDLDGNAETDSFVLFNYLDNDLQFPGESLPATLATVTFNVSESLESATPVTFSEFETAATDDQQTFYRFNSVTATVSPAVVNLDVDDDGRVRANTDGLTILRYLLGQRGEDLARTVFLGGNRTDPAEIAAFLDAGLGTMLDVDDDGRARANTDGLTILRYMLGQENIDLVRTIFLGGNRTDATDVRSHLESFDPTVTAVSSARPASVRIDPELAKPERPQNTLQFRSPYSQTGARSELEATELPEDDSPNAPASTEVETTPKATVQSDEEMAFSATIGAVLTANEWLYQI